MGIFGSYEQASLEVTQGVPKEIPKPEEAKPKPPDGEVEYKDSRELPNVPDIGGSSAPSTDSEVGDIPPRDELVSRGENKEEHKEQAKTENTSEVPAIPKKRVKQTRVKSETVQIPKFPRNVMDFIRHELPSAVRNEDALIAYIYIKSGGAIEVSDDIKKLASTYDGDKTVQNLEQRMKGLENCVKLITKMSQAIEIGISGLILDRKGFSNQVPKDPKSIDFLEDGVVDIRDRLREVSNQQRKDDNIKLGRPIR